MNDAALGGDNTILRKSNCQRYTFAKQHETRIATRRGWGGIEGRANLNRTRRTEMEILSAGVLFSHDKSTSGALASV